MFPRQCGGEGDAGAGDLCTGRVGKPERRGNGDCCRPSGGSAETLSGHRGDNRGLLVRTTAKGDGLAGVEADRTGDRYDSSARVGGSGHGGCAGCANGRDDSGLGVSGDTDRLPGVKVRHAGDFEISCAGTRSGQQGVAVWVRNSVQLLPVSTPSGNRDRDDPA